MSLQIVCAENLRPVRWKNGGGWTHEVLAWPDPVDWVLRISVADIEADGPFSSFPGVDRHFAVLSGEGVVLDIGGEQVSLNAQSPLHGFKGEADTHCRLVRGATSDFNLMVRRERAELDWHPVGEAAPQTADAHWRGLFTLGGGSVRELHGSWVKVPEMSLVWSDSGTPWRTWLAGREPRGWWMQIRMKDASR